MPLIMRCFCSQWQMSQLQLESAAGKGAAPAYQNNPGSSAGGHYFQRVTLKTWANVPAPMNCSAVSCCSPSCS